MRAATDHEKEKPETPIPTNVFQINLPRLAGLVGCSLDELYTNLSHAENASEIEGTVLSKGKQLVFGIEEDEPKTFEPPRTRTALISAAGRPGVLDTTMVPKELIVLEGTNGLTVIELVLRSLYRAGIERVYLVLGWASTKIQEVLEESGLLDLLDIIYVDLGEHYNAGHARSLIKARRYLQDQQPFLICTSDHIFDPRLVYDLANCIIGDSVPPQESQLDMSIDLEQGRSARHSRTTRAIVLVENQFQPLLDSLPGTAVKVRYREDSGAVEEIGRFVTEFNGIDAGLFLASPDIFEVLIDLAAERPYFSLADALARVADDGELLALPTNDLQWTSVETPGQLHETQELLEDGALRCVGPWDVRVVQVPMSSLPSAKSLTSLADDRHTLADFARKQALLLGIPRAPGMHVHLIREHIRSMELDEEERPSKHLSGFVLPVKQAVSEARDNAATLFQPRKKQKKYGRTGYLLPMRAQTITAQEERKESAAKMKRRSARRGDSQELAKLEDLQSADPYILSIPLRRTDQLPELWSPDIGLLLALPQQSADIPSRSYRALLAIPAREVAQGEAIPRVADELSVVFGFISTPTLPELPSDLHSVVIESNLHPNIDEKLSVQVVVTRTVPAVGWVLLLAGFASSCVAHIVTEFQSDTPALFKAFWRQQCSTLLLAMYCLYRYVAHGIDHDDFNLHRRLASAPSSTRPDNARVLLFIIVVSAIGFAVQTDSRLVAEDRTSLALANLFNSWICMLVILFIAVISSIRNAKSTEIAGAFTGLFGATLCLLDKSRLEGSSAIGNFIAILGAVGGAVFVITAKILRKKVDLFHYALCIQLLSVVLSTFLVFILVAMSTELDIQFAIFGWMDPGRGDRLWLQLAVSVLADGIGTLCFIAALLYVEPILLAAMYMAEPIISLFLAAVLGLVPFPRASSIIGGMVLLVGSALILLTVIGPQPKRVDAFRTIEREGEGLPSENIGYQGMARPNITPPSTTDSPSQSLKGMLSKMRLNALFRSKQTDTNEATGLLAYASRQEDNYGSSNTNQR